MQERLQKFISQAGVASRRHAEDLIVAGKVKVNGEIIKELGTKVDPATDKVEVNGPASTRRQGEAWQKIGLQKLIYLVLNKPKRYMTTRYDPERRKTIYQLLPPELRNVVWPVGRLDFHTEGLLILTNDGELTQAMSHPSYEHDKEYEVILDKELSSGRIEKIKNGMMIDGKMTAPAKLRINGTTVYITIHEGMNRQVRKMFGELGYSVRNLKRIRIGKLKLNDLELGQYKMINKTDII
jgi:pseudouridine synthase